MIRGLIGVVHLQPMPGDPRYAGAGGFDRVVVAALADGAALVAGGAEGVIVENFGSAPFAKGTEGHRIEPHQVAALTRVVRVLVERYPEVPVGVNCLRNDAISAIGIAAACGARFVRINVHTGAALTDQGIIEGEAGRTLRYREAIASGPGRVLILADVLVKHARPLAPTDPGQAARDCLERGLADGLIVTGAATGAGVDRARLEAVREAAPHAPIYIGSGLTPDTAPDLAPLADGAIVGTWLKREGRVENRVDEERVKEMSRAVRGLFRGG